ncbi:MAG: hypothetical protein ALECFALPRED_009781 [Alectoria fallacina]|uniref:AB hydrolase-1 domain-containing protein n=1 Tax=Alectoria fallacina TaxID=1903189 RepID=A0A8H3J868_9LECA|nr:MAG: hypothetical protein ALECFALPRED_009781 [Alectoria fallacina]
MPLTVAEIVEHPAFNSVIWDLKPTTKGKCAVAHTRGGPIDIAYEIHGTGPIKLVWIMGLGAFKWYWQRQTIDFGHQQASKYSCLIFDNRGMAESDKPVMRYSTSEMAKDTFELLDQLGWIGEKSVHVIGISMGGMIAQEMAYREPERIASLSLVSTAAQLKNTTGYFENLRSRINIFIPKSIDKQIAQVKTHVSASWLSQPDQDGRFPTNGDRFAAQELTKRQDIDGFTRKGFICQALAAGYHKKSPNQLKQIADKVGRERILVIHGTADNLITVPHAEVLVRELGGEERGVEKRIFDGRGHYIPIEEREAFRGLIEGIVGKAEGIR